MMNMAANTSLMMSPEMIFVLADTAGKEAVTAFTPKPMIVSDPRMREDYVVPDGVCGFAWVCFKGNTPFGRWARKEKKARSAYPSGLMIWVSDYGQSMEKKEVYARAFANVLNENGVQAYSDSRAD